MNNKWMQAIVIWVSSFHIGHRLKLRVHGAEHCWHGIRPRSSGQSPTCFLQQPWPCCWVPYVCMYNIIMKWTITKLYNCIILVIFMYLELIIEIGNPWWARRASPSSRCSSWYVDFLEWNEKVEEGGWSDGSFYILVGLLNFAFIYFYYFSPFFFLVLRVNLLLWVGVLLVTMTMTMNILTHFFPFHFISSHIYFIFVCAQAK